MKNTKFTEGEWKVVNMGLSGDLFDIESDYSDGCIAEIVDNKHDARLIASAPEMYHLLQEIVTNFKHGNSDHAEINDSYIDVIDRLLTKARGGK